MDELQIKFKNIQVITLDPGFLSWPWTTSSSRRSGVRTRSSSTGRDRFYETRFRPKKVFGQFFTLEFWTSFRPKNSRQMCIWYLGLYA
jgi:hypothetical protein